MKHARTKPRHAKPVAAKHGRKRRISPIALIIGVALVIAGATLLGYLYTSQHSATKVNPSPRGQESYDQAGFPEVDWGYWKKKNPDICGWLTVPGTDIDLPICQAPASDPEFYLTHDVQGNYNIYGCLYLDAECSAQGFDSKASLVFGHHMDDGTMLSPLAGYSNADVLAEHQTMLLQTPTSKRILRVAAVDVVDASVQAKALSFPTESSFRAWWKETLQNADIAQSEGAENAARVIGFCTCSYGLSVPDERTLVYAVEQQRFDL